MSAGSVVIAQGAILAGNLAVGIAGVGAIALAATVSQYTERLDWIITGTLYPAICAVKDRTDLLFESFVKSNRLALMWGMPFGVGLALFASDLVSFGIGEQWRPAVGVIAGFGIAAALHQIGFNWDAYFRARSQTRPVAVVTILSMLAFLLVAVPLLFAFGLDGFGIGMVAMSLVSLAGRGYFLTQLFSGLSMTRHILRAIAPTIPAVVVVLAARAVEGTTRSLGVALTELGLYVAVTIAATWLLERDLLREAVAYLRRQSAQGAAAT
jgi:O-antigen/teichoic acid export membrane protein